MIGPLLAASWVACIDKTSDAPDAFAVSSSASPIDLVPAECQALTDAGRVIQLFANPSTQLNSPSALDAENKIGRRYAAQLLQVSPPDPTCDCHGWVFAGGRHWVMSSAIDDILGDNGYQEISSPEVGDLIVYRSEIGGIVTHTGLVRTVDGTELFVESKWGPLGRYLHAPANQPFGTAWAFYRSPRVGHALTIREPLTVASP
jgi:hypothetical protein